MALLFSYGTLRLASVQRAVFGRVVPSEPDAIAGHRLDEVLITDPAVITASGSDVHPMLVPSDESSADVPGTVFDLTDADVAAADAYEVDAYTRKSFTLRSGRTAWVYVLADAQEEAGAGRETPLP